MSLDLETGSNQYATWEPGSASASLAGITLTGWFRPESLLFCAPFQITEGVTDGNLRAGFVLTGAGVISTRARRLDGGTVTTVNGGTLVAGTTYFLAAVVNYTGSRVDTYVAASGSPISRPTGTTTGIAGWADVCDSSDSLTSALGSFGDFAAGEQFDGLIQEARFYQRTLSLAQVQEVFYLGGPGGEPPRAWWQMRDVSGTAATIADSMGNHNATAVNSPVYAANIFTPPPVGIFGGGDHFRRRM